MSKDEQAQHFGEWIRSRRKVQNLTVEAAAARMGISKQYLSVLERAVPSPLTGKPIKPTVETVDAIALGLNVSVDDARLIAGYAPQDTRNESAGFLFKLERGLIGWDDLTESQKQAVMEVAQAAIKAILDISEESKGVLGGTLKLPRANEKRKTG